MQIAAQRAQIQAMRATEIAVRNQQALQLGDAKRQKQDWTYFSPLYLDTSCTAPTKTSRLQTPPSCGGAASDRLESSYEFDDENQEGRWLGGLSPVINQVGIYVA